VCDHENLVDEEDIAHAGLQSQRTKNYAKPDQFRLGLEIVRKWGIHENCDCFNV
jgi:hypothetical protein